MLGKEWPYILFLRRYAHLVLLYFTFNHNLKWLRANFNAESRAKVFYTYKEVRLKEQYNRIYSKFHLNTLYLYLSSIPVQVQKRTSEKVYIMLKSQSKYIIIMWTVAL